MARPESEPRDLSPVQRWRKALQDAGDARPAPGVVLLLYALSAWFRADGTGFISQREIARRTGYSVGAVHKKLSAAIESGWLEKTREGHSRWGDRPNRSAEYRLVIPATSDRRPLVYNPDHDEAMKFISMKDAVRRDAEYAAMARSGVPADRVKALIYHERSRGRVATAEERAFLLGEGCSPG